MHPANSIYSILKQATNALNDISDSAQLDAEILLAHCLNKNRTYLHTWPEKRIEKDPLDCFNTLLKKRLTDYPIAYLTGKKAFWTFDLTVTPEVLVPRPETELLVEIALEKIKAIKQPKILDLGTGSGAIVLALASERPDAILYATDNSTAALQVAKKNAHDLALNRQITFVHSHWVDQIEATGFDLIVSNPPYIDPEDEHLKSTIRHEPLQALIADNNGMKDIEVIIKNSHRLLKPNGYLILEHGYDQANKSSTLLSENNYTDVHSVKDLNQNWRVTLGKK